jgi:hypothetical protein
VLVGIRDKGEEIYMWADLSWIEFVKLLGLYKDNILQAGRLLPIVVLGYLLFELSRLEPFHKNKKLSQYRQLKIEELLVHTLALRQRLLFLVFVSAFVAWSLFFHMLVFMPTYCSPERAALWPESGGAKDLILMFLVSLVSNG